MNQSDCWITVTHLGSLCQYVLKQIMCYDVLKACEKSAFQMTVHR